MVKETINEARVQVFLVAVKFAPFKLKNRDIKISREWCHLAQGESSSWPEVQK
jgi:hypothetical protein